MAAALTRLTARQAFVRSALRECARLRADRWDLAMVTWIPLLAMALFAWMFASGIPRALPIAVVDHDGSSTSRALVRLLDAAPGLHVAARPTGLPQAWSSVRALETFAVVYLPAGTERETLHGGATVFAYYNASHQTSGQATLREIGSVVQAANPRIALDAVALTRGPAAVRPPPLRVQATVLANSARSYEHFLLGLLFPALLHLAACLAMVVALGRELRDGSAGDWLCDCGNRLLPAIAGKLAPYLLLFTTYGVLSLVWLAGIRGSGVAGSAWLLLLAQAAMYLAYAGIALLLVGATRNMGTSLSLTGLYAGTSLAFSGATFPVQGAPLFTQVWTQLLPFTAYVRLQAHQLDLGTAWTASLPSLGTLLLFALLAGGAGLLLFGRGARDPAAWRQR